MVRSVRHGHLLLGGWDAHVNPRAFSLCSTPDTQTLTLYPRRSEQLGSWIPVIQPSNEPESRQISGADHAVGRYSTFQQKTFG